MRFIECKGTAVLQGVQSLFCGISHTKRLALPLFSGVFRNF